MSKLKYILYPKCMHPLNDYKPIGREKVVYLCPVCQATYIILHCKRCFSKRVNGSSKTHDDGIWKNINTCRDCGYKWCEYDFKV